MNYFVIIRGPLASGKSTISKFLAKKLKAEYFAVDGVREDHNLTKEPKEQGFVSQKTFFKINNIISQKAKKFLDKGKIVIFDGNFYWKSTIDDLIGKLNYSHYVFTLKAPLEVCIKRNSKRGKIHGKDAAEAVYKKSTSFNYGTTIDTENQNPEETVKEILKYLPKP